MRKCQEAMLVSDVPDTSDDTEVSEDVEVEETGSDDTTPEVDVPEDVEPADCEADDECELENADGASYTLATDDSGLVTFETTVEWDSTVETGCGILVEVDPSTASVECDGLRNATIDASLFCAHTSSAHPVHVGDTTTCTLTGEPGAHAVRTS